MVTLSTHPNGTAGYCLYVDGAQKACLAAGAQRSGAEPGSAEAAVQVGRLAALRRTGLLPRANKCYGRDLRLLW